MNEKPAIAWFALVIAASAAAFAASSRPTVRAQGATVAASTISVSGSADQWVVPDTAQINAGITTRGSTAAQAQQKNDQAMNRMMAVLKAAGVQPTDIQTAWYNLQPTYGNPRNGQQNITGFQANDNVNITIHRLSQVGPILDSLVKAGANQINNVNYLVANPGSIQKALYGAALADARAQANNIAKKLGLTITGVQSVSTTSTGGIIFPMDKMAAASFAAPALSPGSQDISTTVQVVFRAN